MDPEILIAILAAGLIIIILMITCKCDLQQQPTRVEAIIQDSTPYPSMYPEISLPGHVETMTTDIANECVVCLDTFNTGEKIRILDCGHYYHTKCIDEWLKNKNCPKCFGENV